MSGPVVKKWIGADNTGLTFWCPGCDEVHSIRLTPAGWDWNQDVISPTLNPSVLVTGYQSSTDAEHEKIMQGEQVPRIGMRCHSFVRDGNIQYLDDCTHDRKGQTIPLPELSTWRYE